MYSLCHAEDANRMRKHHTDRKYQDLRVNTCGQLIRLIDTIK